LNCRHCNKALEHAFLDLGFQPPSNSYLTCHDLKRHEKYFPLKVFVCDACWLVQTEDYLDSDQFFNEEYAYFSSISSSWVKHAKHYCDMIIKRLELDDNSFVVELASNDGYLLQNFVDRGIQCLGVEPTLSTAKVAEEKGITVIKEFFGRDFALKKFHKEKGDLIIGNNVYAHVPNINDFTEGLKEALAIDGVITLEFPHIMRLIEHSQFDTVYHEHFSYLSLISVSKIFKCAGLRVFDVEELSTHGGSLRIFGCHDHSTRSDTLRVAEVIDSEKKMGLTNLGVYKQFQARAEKVKNTLTSFLIEQKRLGKTVAAFGAAAKGNTILNYAGIRSDLLSFVCDSAPSKQGKFMPGSHIPILMPNALKEKKPDYILILPWNIASEVMNANSFVRDWGAKFVVAVPELSVFE
jgi:hypothetical protein